MSSETNHIDFFVVSEKEAGERLDKLLATHFSHHSRTYFQYLIDHGSVLLNSEKVKKREKAQEGDEVEVCFLLTPEISLEPENIPLDILYEDEYLLAVNKPVGMVVHPAPGNPSHTFVNALLFHCGKINTSDERLRPGIVHRLDKDTSGILLAAKTVEAHQKLVSIFCNRLIEKQYLAICVGNPGNVLIDAPIKRHPIHRKEMAVCQEGGKSAMTRCSVLSSQGNLSLVQIELLTGRTHQIRVHLKHHKTPILGDPVYGAPSANQKYGTSRQFLHAHTLKFLHPITSAPLHLSAPLPPDMADFIEKHSLS